MAAGRLGDEVFEDIPEPPGPSGDEPAAAPPKTEGIGRDVSAREQAETVEGPGAAARAADPSGAGTAPALVLAADADGFAPGTPAAPPTSEARTGGAEAEGVVPGLTDDRPEGAIWNATRLSSRRSRAKAILMRPLLAGFAVILACSISAPVQVSASGPTAAAPKDWHAPVPIPGSTSGGNEPPQQGLLPGIGPTFKQLCVIDKQTVKPWLHWIPERGKFLLAYCDYGQTSNRLMCLEGALVMAAHMNRTLIFEKQDMCMTELEMRKTDEMKQYGGHVIDLPYAVDEAHLKACLNLPEDPAQASQDALRDSAVPTLAMEDGLPRLQPDNIPEAIIGRRLVTLDELLNATGLHALVVDKLRCQFRNHCIRKTKKCRAQGKLVFPEPEFGDWEPFTKIEAGKMAELVETTRPVNVLLLGDYFPFPINGYGMKPGMIDTSCVDLVRPVPQVLQDAADFITSSLPLPYAAIHLRRGDFKSYCQRRNCHFFSLNQIAHCMAEEMQRSGLTVLFVATNARSHEAKALSQLLDAKGIKMVIRPTNASHFVRAALVEKVICAHAQQFFRQHGSTFSGSILNLRMSIQAPVCRDKFICQGFETDFVPPPEKS